MNDRDIIFDYFSDSIAGIPNAAWTTIPGTEVKLQEGKYLANGIVRLGGVRGAFDGNTNTLFVRDLFYNRSYSQVLNVSNSQNIELTIPYLITYDVITTLDFGLQVYINLNGTVVSRSILKANIIIEKLK